METESKKEQLEQLVTKIKACDRARPFYYVSYAMNDGMTVHEDVLALQEEGINLWIDIPANFNTGEGFNATIFNTIADKMCLGILYYMSEDSMTSTQNAKEIAYTRSTKTLEASGEALPVYVVEAEDIPNSDYAYWVNEILGKNHGEAALNVAERANINDYRDKYNSKIAVCNTKLEVAQAILNELNFNQAGEVKFSTEDRREGIKKLLV